MLKRLGPKSTCLRAKIAAIAVKNGKILATGDNSFHKCYDCNVIGCIRDIQQIPSGSRREICYGICAEQRMMANAAKKGVQLTGATLYVTSHPCRVCEGIIAESGIARVHIISGTQDGTMLGEVFKAHGCGTMVANTIPPQES